MCSALVLVQLVRNRNLSLGPTTREHLDIVVCLPSYCGENKYVQSGVPDLKKNVLVMKREKHTLRDSYALVFIIMNDELMMNS